MASVNKWIGIGNLGRDPEVRYRPDGSAICNITIACSSQWKDKSTGENREETEWVRVVFYNRLAEIAGEYLRKGKPVYIEGRLKTRKWQDKDGQDRYTTEIIADQMQMLGGRDSGGDSSETTAPRQAPSAPARPTAPSSYQSAKDGNLDDLESDIPF